MRVTGLSWCPPVRWLPEGRQQAAAACTTPPEVAVRPSPSQDKGPCSFTVLLHTAAPATSPAHRNLRTSRAGDSSQCIWLPGVTGPVPYPARWHWDLGGNTEKRWGAGQQRAPPLLYTEPGTTLAVPQNLGPTAGRGSSSTRPETAAPGNNVGFNGINIQEVTRQFCLATSRGVGLLPLWAGLRPPVCPTAFENLPPGPGHLPALPH